MARYGPTVLPRAFDFGGIIERALRGYRYGRGLRRERQEEREREEDRRLLRERMRRKDLSQPGASTLADYLDTALAAGRQPLTEESLQRIGRASEEDVDFEFRRPEPTSVRLPSGQTAQLQERAPFMAETGVVIDPSRARQERTLGAYLDRQMLREPVKKPWEREGFGSEREYLDFVTGKSRAEGAGRPRSAAELRPPITLNQALDAVDRLYGVWDEKSQTYTYPFDEQQRYQIARNMVAGATSIPARPKPPMMVAPPIRATPPRQAGERGGISRIFGAIGDFFRGRRGGQDGAPQAAPTPPVAPGAPGPQGPTPEGAVSPNELPQPRSLEELDVTPEQQAKYDQLLAEGWAHDDIMDELAADEWDLLVQGGMAPDDATRQVAQKYGRTEAP
jgi:hypothetical protein